MNHGTWAVMGLSGLMALSGCTAKYQQRILDQNEMIHRYQVKLAKMRQENNDYASKIRKLNLENEHLRKKPTKPVVNRKRDKNRSALAEAVGSKGKVKITDGMLTLEIPSMVTFSAGKRVLSNEGRRVLQRVADVLKTRFPRRKIYVAGHTDNQPIKKTKKLFRSNRHLSSERADAVATYLIRSGVKETQVVIMGCGSTEPTLPNKTAKGRQANRRVEIKISGLTG